MGKEYKEKEYGELMVALDHCEKESEAELEIYNPNYTYQRCYALKAMVECLRELGKKRLAILYGYEQKHLERDVLEARKKEVKFDNI